MTEIVALIFPALLVAAAATDLSSFSIPNRLTAALVLCWPLAALTTDLAWLDMLGALVLSFIVLSVGFVLFAKRLLGGGDAKLLAAVALWVGPGQFLPFAMITAIAGAVLALVLLSFRRMPLPAMAVTHDWIVQLHQRPRDMPYGVAIAVGGLVVWPRTPFGLF